jgi:hypothetical protein
MAIEIVRSARQLPPERTVDCACDAALHVPVLTRATPCRVNACLRCGTVTCTEAHVWEPRPHDVRVASHEVIPLPDALLAWLGTWPRLLERATGTLYLAAGIRCPRADALPALLAEAAARDAGAGRRARGARLRGAGPPVSPPPVVPTELAAFAAVHAALALDPDTADPAWLLATAARHHWDAVGVVAIELVLRRGDAVALLRAAVRDGGADAHAGALAVLAEPPRALLPTLLPALCASFDATPLERGASGRGSVAAAPRVGAALDLLVAPASLEALPEPARREAALSLRTLAQRVGRHDWALVRRLQDAAHALDRD